MFFFYDGIETASVIDVTAALDVVDNQPENRLATSMITSITFISIGSQSICARSSPTNPPKYRASLLKLPIRDCSLTEDT